MGLKGVLWQEEAHLNSASWQQSSSSLRALCEHSCPREGRTPCQLLASMPEPSLGAGGVGHGGCVAALIPVQAPGLGSSP